MAKEKAKKELIEKEYASKIEAYKSLQITKKLINEEWTKALSKRVSKPKIDLPIQEPAWSCAVIFELLSES